MIILFFFKVLTRVWLVFSFVIASDKLSLPEMRQILAIFIMDTLATAIHNFR